MSLILNQRDSLVLKMDGRSTYICPVGVPLCFEENPIGMWSFLYLINAHVTQIWIFECFMKVHHNNWTINKKLTCLLKDKFARAANSRASASFTVSSLAQPAFTSCTLSAPSGHILGTLMLLNDSSFTVLIPSSQPGSVCSLLCVQPALLVLTSIFRWMWEVAFLWWWGGFSLFFSTKQTFDWKLLYELQLLGVADKNKSAQVAPHRAPHTCAQVSSNIICMAPPPMHHMWQLFGRRGTSF